jgi:hypothetical protein
MIINKRRISNGKMSRPWKLGDEYELMLFFKTLFDITVKGCIIPFKPFGLNKDVIISNDMIKRSVLAFAL